MSVFCQRLLSLFAALPLLCASCGTERDGAPDGAPSVESQTQEQTTCGLFAGDNPRKAVNDAILEAFFPCCNGAGRYVPESLIPKDSVNLLEQGPRETRCVPAEIARDPLYQPAECTSKLGLKGVCMSLCIPLIKTMGANSTQGSCAPNQVCLGGFDLILKLLSGAKCGKKNDAA